MLCQENSATTTMSVPLISRTIPIATLFIPFRSTTAAGIDNSSSHLVVSSTADLQNVVEIAYFLLHLARHA
jgi:hypothetical protein